MSLHERFTKLKFDKPTVAQSSSQAPPASSSLVYKHKPIPVKTEDGGYIRSDYSPPRGRRPTYSPTPIRSSRPRTRTPDQPRYSARRMRSVSPMERIRRNISPQGRRSRYDDRNPNLFSTNRVKKKSVYLRLGVRPRSSLADRMSDGIPVWTQHRQTSWGGGGMSRSQSSHSLNRWNSQGSLENSYDVPRYQLNSNRRFRGNRGQRGGGRRNFAYNNQGRWRYGQGWFGRRRGGQGGNRGGNRYNNRRGGGNRGGWTSRFSRPAPAKREDLDAELDAYMANTRGVLDNQLDSYMASATRS